MNRDIISLIGVLINTGIVAVILCGCGCFYLRLSIISQNRQIENNRHHNHIVNIYPNMLVNEEELYFPQEEIL